MRVVALVLSDVRGRNPTIAYARGGEGVAFHDSINITPTNDRFDQAPSWGTLGYQVGEFVSPFPEGTVYTLEALVPPSPP